MNAPCPRSYVLLAVLLAAALVASRTCAQDRAPAPRSVSPESASRPTGGSPVESPPATLEFRMLARSDFDERGVRFDLEAERTRLRAWLQDEKNRRRVIANPTEIALFNLRSAELGGPLAGAANLQWVPRKVLRDPGNGQSWERYLVSQKHSQPDTFAVAVFDEADYAAGPEAKRKAVIAALTPEQARLPDAEREALVASRTFLLELVPVNMCEEHFDATHLDASGVQVITGGHVGGVAIGYAMRDEHKLRYADFSERNRGKHCAIVLNGILHSLPTFVGRIKGPGIILGSFTEAEATALATGLKHAASQTPRR